MIVYAGAYKYEIEGEPEMILENRYREMAEALHQEFPVVDVHLDLAGELYCRKENGEKIRCGIIIWNI